jgi:hypothetical protein
MSKGFVVVDRSVLAGTTNLETEMRSARLLSQTHYFKNKTRLFNLSSCSNALRLWYQDMIVTFCDLQNDPSEDLPWASYSYYPFFIHVDYGDDAIIEYARGVAERHSVTLYHPSGERL